MSFRRKAGKFVLRVDFLLQPNSEKKFNTQLFIQIRTPPPSFDVHCLINSDYVARILCKSVLQNFRRVLCPV